MPDEEFSAKQISIGILFFIIIIGGYITADYFLQWKNEQVEPEKVEEKQIAEIIKEYVEIVAPKNEELDGVGGSVNGFNELTLIDKPYTPSGDVYDNKKIYDNTVPRVGLIGEFEIAALMINGEINNDKLNFISINIGETSGTYGVERLNRNKLNLNSIKYSDALLTKGHDNKFEVVIDLVGNIILSTTGREYLSGYGKSKDISLWDSIKPTPEKDYASLARMYALTYDENGYYGDGSKITKLTFIYACKAGNDSCGAVVCERNYDPGNTCLIDKFGQNTDIKYNNYFK